MQTKHSAVKVKQQTALRGKYRFTLRNIHTGETKTFVYKNIIPLVARSLIASAFTDPLALPMLINNFAVGASATAPDPADTTLTSETYRNDVASRTSGDNIFYVTGFIDAAEDFGTYMEAGLFAGGDGSLNSGVLISHVSINVTKSNVETLTIDFEGEII